MNAKTEQAFQHTDKEFLKLSELAMTRTDDDLRGLKAECIQKAEEILIKSNATLEETEHANMLLNFAQCELAGVEI